MDLNLVVLAGRLAAPPEIRRFESGAQLVRYLLTVRTDKPKRRVDVVPVVCWHAAGEAVVPAGNPGMRVWVAGGVQRRFWDGGDGRRSRLEIVAHQVELREDEGETGLMGG